MTIINAIIDVSEHIGAPGTASIHITPVGGIGGIRLKDGRLARPWITWEIEEPDGSHRDLEHDELVALGFAPTLDKTIGIELA